MTKDYKALYGIDTCGVPTPGMGPWKRPESTAKRPRYAIADSFSIPDAELIRLHVQEKKTAVELAKMTGETPRFIRLKLKGKGCKRCYRRNYRPLKKTVDSTELLLRYELGYSPSEMVGFFKVSANTIRDRLRRLGRRRDYKTSVQYAKGKIAHHIKNESELKKYGVRTKMKKADGRLFDW